MILSRLAVSILQAVCVAAQVTYQNSSQTILRVDNGTYGPEIEEVHYCELFACSGKTYSDRAQIMGSGRLG